MRVSELQRFLESNPQSGGDSGTQFPQCVRLRGSCVQSCQRENVHEYKIVENGKTQTWSGD